MVVTIEQIRDEGLSLDEPISAELIAQALAHEGKETGYRAARGSRLQANLQRVSGGVLLHGSFAAEFLAPCNRCLAEVTVRMPVSFTLNLIPRDKADGKKEGDVDDDHGSVQAGTFALEDADEELFDGKTIDLDPILREQVLLALPMQVVCDEDCKGLCPMCGQNRNEKQCGCAPKVVDPRLAALKDIKLNKLN
ncbi:MAG: YceD family protein [Myxococcaceae bacterium]